MTKPLQDERKLPRGVRAPASKQSNEFKASEESEESLREQTKTETEQRPYLDTEGGE